MALPYGEPTLLKEVNVIKDTRIYENKELKLRAFWRGYRDGLRFGEYSTKKAVSWQSVGNETAVNGLNEIEAEKYFEGEFDNGTS